jgi:hypothetical protein
MYKLKRLLEELDKREYAAVMNYLRNNKLDIANLPKIEYDAPSSKVYRGVALTWLDDAMFLLGDNFKNVFGKEFVYKTKYPYSAWSYSKGNAQEFADFGGGRGAADKNQFLFVLSCKPASDSILIDFTQLPFYSEIKYHVEEELVLISPLRCTLEWIHYPYEEYIADYKHSPELAVSPEKFIWVRDAALLKKYIAFLMKKE